MMQLRRTEFMGDKLSTQVHNQRGSTRCISRLTKSIICNIYYERRLLPEDFFVTKLIEGIPVKEFAPEVGKHPRIYKLEEWVLDLIRSIEKKELKNVSLELITIDQNKLVETYNLRYSYRDELTAKKVPEQFTSTSIRTMLKNMKNIFKNKLNPLVNKNNMRFRVTADTTGEGRESSVFSCGKKRMMEFATDCGKLEIEMGTVCTPFHRLILKVTADVKQREDDDTEDDVIIVEEITQKSTRPEIIELDDEDDDTPLTASTSATTITELPEYAETESSKLYSTIVEMSNLKMSCICATEIRDNVFTIMQCMNCSTYQHAECYGIHKISKIPGRHLCHDCSCLLIDSFGKTRSPSTGKIISQENHNHTDPRLVEFTIGELKEIGRIRLVLMYIFREKKSPLRFIEKNFQQRDFERILEKLLNHGVIIRKHQKFHLDPIKVNVLIRKHFKPKYSINKYF